MTELIPVTIITGFLGSGKTTLLKRILQGDHGVRIAVIENEFAAESIDHGLLVQDSDEQIVEMNNGCICCSVRGDLIRILGELYAKRESGTIVFDHVLIETTGLAAPGPVAQTFFAEPSVSECYMLDAILTVVDARHAQQQLTAHKEAQEQVGFADRILLSKTDLVDKDALAEIKAGWSETYGDRYQELVFIGRDMDQAAIEADLNKCQLNATETDRGMAAWRQLSDPFPQWQRMEELEDHA